MIGQAMAHMNCQHNLLYMVGTVHPIKKVFL